MIPFWKIIPGGNPTVLLQAADVPKAKRAAVAVYAMDPERIGCEQVGFFAKSGIPQLEMMGGEFCVNATRALALLLALESDFSNGQGGTYDIGLCREPARIWRSCCEVSGADRPVLIQVEEQIADEKTYYSGAGLRFAHLPELEELEGGIAVVRLPGIVHLILRESLPSDADLKPYCAALRQQCQLNGEAAVGYIHLGSTGAGYFINPVVWVRETDTLCRETACGSGTMAAAVFLRRSLGDEQYEILQPSGQVLSVMFRDDGGTIWIFGPARISSAGQLDYPDL